MGPTGFPVRDAGDLKTSNRSTAFRPLSPFSEASRQGPRKDALI